MALKATTDSDAMWDFSVWVDGVLRRRIRDLQNKQTHNAAEEKAVIFYKPPISRLDFHSLQMLCLTPCRGNEQFVMPVASPNRGFRFIEAEKAVFAPF